MIRFASRLALAQRFRRNFGDRLRAGSSRCAWVSAFPREPVLREAHARLDRRRQQGRQGRPSDNFIGGPKAIPTFESARRCRPAMVDLGFSTGAFYTT